MNKKMRELKAKAAEQNELAKTYLDEGDIAKAEEALDKRDEIQKEYDVAARVMETEKAEVPADQVAKSDNVDGFEVLNKFLAGKKLNDKEKAALLSEENEYDLNSHSNLLIPEDVKVAINELRKTYVSAKDIITVEQTASLTGSVNYEDGTPAGLVNFIDGDTLSEEENVSFTRKQFSIGHYGKLIPISRILQGAEKAGLMGYLNRWFLKNAIITENTAIFTALKNGYNDGTPKALAGWKALKKSINVDLDPSCKIGGIIVTNQSGFAALDEEEDKDGRPVLQANPAHPTEKLFQGLPVKVFPDALLPNIDATHFPVIYGDTKAGATFVEHTALEFAVSEHIYFGKNQNCLRVIEGFDVMSTDTSAYIYGSFTASAT